MVLSIKKSLYIAHDSLFFAHKSLYIAHDSLFFAHAPIKIN